MKLFAAALAAAALACVSAFSDPPQQLHIAYAGNNAGRSDGMSVMWHTNNATSTSIVKYGTQSGTYSSSISGQERYYGFTYDHVAVLPNLQPSTRYFYIVGDDEAGWSQEFSFESAGALSPSAEPWKFMLYGDDAFLADPLKFGYENRWNEYMQAVEFVAATKPYMVLPGNHEAECHSGFCELDNTLKHKLTNFTAYNHRFRMPAPETGGVENMWYSFNHKNVHFVSINTETDYPNSPNDEYAGLTNGGFGNQLGWLESDLRKANASRAAGEIAWIFVSGHRPVYSLHEQKNGVPSGSAAALQTAVEAMFNLYGVDMFFCGHVHSYERQWPTVNNVPQKSYNNPRAPVYIVNGAGGNIEGVTKYDHDTPADWNVVHQSVWGLGELTVYNSSHVHWEFYEASNQTVTDEMWLVKE